MKQIELTQGYVALVDDEDYKRVSPFKWFAVVDRDADGEIKNVYAARHTSRTLGKRSTVYLHRFVRRAKVGTEVDHKDRNGLNCQKYNLRKATTSQNQRNKRLSKNSTSGFKGVRKTGSGKWQAHINVGSFLTKKEAAYAYDRVARLLFGRFARTNFPQKGKA